MTPRVSIVIPVYNEGDHVVDVLDRIIESVQLPFEILVVYDDESDTTVPALEAYNRMEPRVRPLPNTYGSGPASAIHFGIDAASACVRFFGLSATSDSSIATTSAYVP